VIGPMTANCVSETTITIPDHGQVSKYTIATDKGGEYYYVDGIDLLSSMQEVASEMGVANQLPADLPIDQEMLSMDTVPATQAEQQIQDISDYRAEIAGESSSGNGSLNLDTTMLLLIVAIVAVAIVLAVLVLRRKPKAP